DRLVGAPVLGARVRRGPGVHDRAAAAQLFVPLQGRERHPAHPLMRPRGAIAALAAAVLVALTGAAPSSPRYTRQQMEAAVGERERWLFVSGTHAPAQADVLRDRALAIARRLFGGDTTAVVADRDAREEELARRPLLLLGGPDQNEWTRKLASSLPVQ